MASNVVDLMIKDAVARIDDEYQRALHLYDSNLRANSSINDIKVQLTNILATALTGNSSIRDKFENDPVFGKQ